MRGVDREGWAQFGEWLKGERQRRGLTQKEVGERAEVSVSWLVTLEAGGRNYRGAFQLPSPTPQNLRSLADAIDLDREDVFRRAGREMPDWARGTSTKTESSRPITDQEREELRQMRRRIDEILGSDE